MAENIDLAEQVADLFILDARTEPADALPHDADSADCTNNGCTQTCRGC